MIDKTLGLLALENNPTDPPEEFQNKLPFPVKRLVVPGAWARKLRDGDRSAKDAYVSCARQLEREGVAAITANCGFSSLFQAEVSDAVSIPVALSSLLLVPFVASTLPRGQKVGILTYDASKLAEHHFEGAGWSSRDISVSVAGIEGSETWHQLDEPDEPITLGGLINDVVAAAKSLMTAEPAVATLVLECTAFPLAAETVRREVGLPVVDCVSLAKTLIDMSPSP